MLTAEKCVPSKAKHTLYYDNIMPCLNIVYKWALQFGTNMKTFTWSATAVCELWIGSGAMT